MKADLSSRALVRNTGWNVIGYAAPAMVAVICIPPLLRALGIERFGILTLAWVLIGYLGLFDLGIGRALTKLIAERRATSTQTELASLAQTALVALLGLGFVGTLAGLALSGLLAREVLAIPAPLQAEAAKSLAILFLALPLVVSSAALAGLLEAFQRFDLVNAVRVPLGIASFVFPLGATALSPDLVTVALSLVLVRLAGWAGYSWLANRLLRIADRWRFEPAQVRALLRLGGWMTVSSVAGPLMVYLDRFVLGARTTMSAVAYYATPFELITKLLVVPSAVGGVLFPGFASLHAADPSGFRRLGRIGTALILAALFPVALALVLFAGELLAMWLDAEFARHSRRVVQWLALGTFLNAAAHVPFAALQAAGRPDLTAKLHLAELPLYLGGLALGVSLMG
ncbi:MAG: flippase, partial [Burkholderiales bacterium]